MRYYIFSSFFIVFMFSSCTSSFSSDKKIEPAKPQLKLSQVDRWNMMVGKWYGKHEMKNGGYREHIAERTKNGQYKLTFRTYDKEGNYKEQIEVGEWGISGPYYFTMYRGQVKDKNFFPVDSSNPYNYDAYEILKITKSEFKYKHVEYGDIFTIKKVPLTFTFESK